MRFIKAISIVALFISAIFHSAFSNTLPDLCPTLTREDIEDIINNGTIVWNQAYTLAEEAGKTRAQVLIDEPTANPFDTYYQMFSRKTIEGKMYWININYVLGKDIHEAKERATKILLSNPDAQFDAVFNPESKSCLYKQVHASKSDPNFPFKTIYESITLVALLLDDEMEDQVRTNVNNLLYASTLRKLYPLK